MNKRYFEAAHVRAENWEAGKPMRFVASTENLARDGAITVMEGCQTENYRKNPVFLWMHNYWEVPIGRVVNLVFEMGRMVIEVLFDQSDEFAQKIERKYADGFLNAVSIGWDTLEYEKGADNKSYMITKWELLDISAVTVPGDPDALIMRTYQGLKEIVDGNPTPALPISLGNREGANPSTGSGTGEDEWSRTAAEMVAVFDLASDDPDEEREKRYKALLPMYRRLDKVAPEFLPMAQLRALSDNEIAGLFLEGEVIHPTPVVRQAHQPDLDGEKRAGAVLSAKNLTDLGQAISLIQGVVDRAKKEEAAAADDPADDERSMAYVGLSLLTIQAQLMGKH